MAKAIRLKSGNYRVLVYSHTDKEMQPDGSIKKVRRYVSFTHPDKSEAEFMAADFARNRKQKLSSNLTLGEAIDEYIGLSDGKLSPSTVAGYKKIKRNHFPTLISMRIKTIKPEDVAQAVNAEYKRKSKKYKDGRKTISEKTVANAYSLLASILRQYAPQLDLNVKLAAPAPKIKELLTPDAIFAVVYETEIELPVLLAMWLSFSMSEIRGLTKSKSISGDYITIRETVIVADNADHRREKGKAATRIRRHRMPGRIKELINDVDGDVIVPLSGHAIYMRWSRLLAKNNMQHITFHDLRHVNASVMMMLRVPDKYAMERGGWKTDKVMKSVYQHTYSAEREAVDNAIDEYFNLALANAMQHEMQHKK